ncbi:helix-turn-helix domain-containing protein [Nocardia asiatica]
MTKASVRVGVGTRLTYDGDIAEVIEMHTSEAGNELVLRVGSSGRRLVRVASWEALASHRAQFISDSPGPASDDPGLPASIALDNLSDEDKRVVGERAAHVREVLSGYRSGSAELAAAGEPRAEFAADTPMMSRYRAKATELGVSVRTVTAWVYEFRRHGEAGLAPKASTTRKGPAGMSTNDGWRPR